EAAEGTDCHGARGRDCEWNGGRKERAAMNDWLASFGPIASVAASALVSALWEGAVLAGLTWAALRAFPRLSAAARSMVWLGVFALLIGLQVLPLVLPGNQGRVAVPDASVSYGLHL